MVEIGTGFIRDPSTLYALDFLEGSPNGWEIPASGSYTENLLKYSNTLGIIIIPILVTSETGLTPHLTEWKFPCRYAE